MPRKPKAKNTLSAGERVALFEAEQEQKRRAMINDSASKDKKIEESVAKEAIAVQDDDQKLEKKRAPKPKPQSATVRVDLSIPTGEIKPMHGMCNGPVSYGADISDKFREIGVPLVRFDCTDTAAGGYAVDISKIFHNFDKDPSDPSNYEFECTDRYVEAALLCGAKVIYRLGESRDLLGVINPPKCDSIDLLSRVCVNIIRHYNEGWAHGYRFGIEYFELWSAGDDLDADIEVYGRLANAVKMHDDNIKVGGMCFESASGARELIRACKKHRYPIDFVTVESFCGDPLEVGRETEGLARFAKSQGFGNIEIIVGKWMFADEETLGQMPVRDVLAARSAKALEKRWAFAASQRSVKGAAYDAAMMLHMNTLGCVSSACFFDAQPSISLFCSITDKFGKAEKPCCSFRAYGELYNARNAVLCSVDDREGMAHSGIYASAALSSFGEGVIMLASYEGCSVIDLRIDGISEDQYTADIYMLDGVKNMELADSVPLSGMKKRLVLNVSQYGAVLVKLH